MIIIINFNVVCLLAGETAQVHTVRQVFPDARRSEISHVRAQRIVAFQVSHL